MALIKCLECTGTVSDHATVCPHCGFPLKGIEALTDSLKTQKSDFSCPVLPSDLSVGSQVINWTGDAGITGKYDAALNVIPDIKPGKVDIVLCKQGIMIVNFSTSYKIHRTQLINLKCVKKDIILKNKINEGAVVFGALAGGLLFGPIGAIIGGMDGLTEKLAAPSVKDQNFLIITFWDKNTRKPQFIIMAIDNESKVQRFIDRVNRDLYISNFYS